MSYRKHSHPRCLVQVACAAALLLGWAEGTGITAQDTTAGTAEEAPAAAEATSPEETTSDFTTELDAEPELEGSDPPGGDGILQPVPAVMPAEVEVSPKFEEAFLRRVEQAYRSVLAVRGTFRQTRVSDIFLEIKEDIATFFVRKPERFRMAYHPADAPGGANAPPESLHYFHDGFYMMYLPAWNQVERFRVNTDDSHSIESLNIMLLGFDLRAANIFDVYRVTLMSEDEDASTGASLTTLSFEPLRPATIRYMHITFEEHTGESGMSIPRPRRIFYEEETGDTAELTMQALELFTSRRDIEQQPELSEDSFVPSFPADVQIIEN